MGDYIERGEIEIALSKRYDRLTGRSPDFLAGYAYAYQVIEEDTIAADVRPVVLGEWRNNKNEYPECTECGYMPMFDPNMDDIYYSPFCPNCGADMRGGSA